MQRDSTIEEISNALIDWLDFDKTPRKIIARRQAFRPLQQGEAAAMKAAQELLMDGRVSIITKPTFDAQKRRIITYIAERV